MIKPLEYSHQGLPNLSVEQVSPGEVAGFCPNLAYAFDLDPEDPLILRCRMPEATTRAYYAGFIGNTPAPGAAAIAEATVDEYGSTTVNVREGTFLVERSKEARFAHRALWNFLIKDWLATVGDEDELLLQIPADILNDTSHANSLAELKELVPTTEAGSR